MKSLKMFTKNLKIVLILIIGYLLINNSAFAQDPNFHIYLCFGQSNMGGAARAEAQDSVVNSRFQVIMGMDCPDINREMGKWYKAVPPLCDCRSGISPADYFGRTLVENLPENIKVGIINVAVGGCKIELFNKENYQSYVDSAPGRIEPQRYIMDKKSKRHL